MIHFPVHPDLERVTAHLSRLVATPSFSDEEEKVADLWERWLKENGATDVKRLHNNVYAIGKEFDPGKPLLMLNSHLDTVRPSASYTRDPFDGSIEEGKLFGLGSNDAGAAGVALANTFLRLHERKDPGVNLLLAITASEERMGEKGMRAFLPHLKEKGLYPDMVIVGEPTGMKAAVGERGLVVLDGKVKGLAGHAARNEGINALYRAIEDIELLKNYEAPEVSDLLGKLNINVTMINAGTQHNVVPAECTYVVDVRTIDCYTNQETADLLQSVVKWSVLTPRSVRVQASALSADHPLFKAAENLGLSPFVSPTTSDMALMHGLPSLKIGPGESSRSHGPDEFILLDEINTALHLYPGLIENIRP